MFVIFVYARGWKGLFFIYLILYSFPFFAAPLLSYYLKAIVWSIFFVYIFLWSFPGFGWTVRKMSYIHQQKTLLLFLCYIFVYKIHRILPYFTCPQDIFVITPSKLFATFFPFATIRTTSHFYLSVEIFLKMYDEIN